MRLTEHEDMRRRLWCEVWIATAGASNTARIKAPTEYADEALKQFDERFKEPEPEPEPEIEKIDIPSGQPPIK